MQTIENKADVLIRFVALATRTPSAAFMKRSRGQAPQAFARQIAMYLLHTQFGCSQMRVGEIFRREKSTVGHAVKLVEDHRDDDAFDRWLCALEEALSLCIRAEEICETSRVKRLLPRKDVEQSMIAI